MTVNDSQHEDEDLSKQVAFLWEQEFSLSAVQHSYFFFNFFFLLDVAEIADEVYMEVIVGEEDAAAAHEQQIDDTEIKTFMPIAWAAAYGK